jgi:5-methylcytosine-specific restriction enzyme subunit McrC
MNAYYRGSHELAWLILGGLGIEDVLATGSINSFAFLLNMNLLFERFVWVLFSMVLRDTQVGVGYQKRNRLAIWDPDAGRPYQTVIPDLLLDRRRDRLPVDAKYKLYDEHSIPPGDVYQAFLYSYAFSEVGTHPRAVIAYPASGSSRLRRLAVRRSRGVHAAEITLLGIPIVATLEELRSGFAGLTAEAIRRLILASTSVGAAATTVVDTDSPVSLAASP